MSSVTNIGKLEYKICASKGCIRTAIYQLKIIYLNKLGWFCEQCKDDLESNDLILKENM